MAAGTIEDIYPLTPTQQGMLFHALLAPGSASYFEQLGCRLCGRLDAAAFREAWQRLVDRHAVLRTAFDWQEADEPVQVVLDRLAVPWETQDWRQLAAPEQQRRLDSFLAADRERGFDLARAPLLRLALLRLADDEHHFLFSHHHLLLDGWSLPLLFGELFALYDGLVEGRDVALAAPRPFRDYVAWHRRRDAGPARAHWRARLAGLAPPAQLPIVRPAPPDHQPSIRQQAVRLPAGESIALRRLAKRLRITPSSVVHGAWAVLLGRYTAATEVVFGVTVSGRPPELPGAESMLGLFISTLPARIPLPPAQPAGACLAELQRQLAEMQDHQALPLAEVQALSGLPAGQPLFESIVVFENYPVDRALLERGAAPGIRDLQLVDRTSYPLTVTADLGDELRLRLLYDERRVEPAAAARLPLHLASLLTALAAGAEAAPAELPMLGTGERWQLLGEWNDTARALPADRLLHDLVADRLALRPHEVAVVIEGESLTAGELDRRAGRLAGSLRRLGAGPDERIGVCAERSLELVIGLLGVLKAGAAYVPLDPQPAARLATTVADARVRILLAQERFVPALPAGHGAMVLGLAGAIDAAMRAGAGEAVPGGPSTLAGTRPQNLAYVIYTSGSTGRPKGAMNTHAAIVNRLLWMQERYRLGTADRVLQKTPLTFDVSVWELFWPLLSGARLVLAAPSGHRDPAYLVDLIVRQEVTTLHFVPSMLRAFLERPDVERCVSLRRVVASGEALPHELQRRFFARLHGAGLHNLYGPTEAAVDVTSWECEREAPGPLVPIGRPIANLRILLLDRDFGLTAIGVPGELCIGGAGLARGYLHRPELTAERFVPDPAGAGGRLYRTGDLARRLPDGRLEFLGRFDFQVKLRGVRIELGEIEAALLSHPRVAEAVVVAREDRPGDQRLIAYLVPAGGVAPAPAELARHLAAVLPELMLPASFVQLDRLPLSANGKVDRRALPAPVAERPAAGAGAVRTPVEEVLQGIFQEVLGLGEVGAGESFFALGGHSLLAMQVVARVRRALGVELPVRTVFEEPTVAGLAAAVERARSAASEPPPPLVPVARDGDLAASHAQLRLWFLEQLAPGAALYNIAAPVRLTGPLDVAALRRSLAEVLRRHEALRTTFEIRDGRLLQRIAPAREASVPLVDLTRLGGGGEAMRLACEQARRSFDLARGPLLRLALLRESAELHLLALTLHHAVADGWSMGVLVGELLALYPAFAAGLPAPLAELPIQYADFAAWQRDWLEGGVLAAQLAYWREQLAGEAQVLELPADRPRPPVASRRGAERQLRLSVALTAALQALGRREGATLFMVLLGGFVALLGRLAGQERFTVGTPVANRCRPELDGLIGPFVNTLVLGADLRGDPTFAELLGRVRQTALAGYQHQDLPFELLVDALQPARDLSRGPLFEVLFTLQNAPRPALRLANLAMSMAPVPSVTAKFDLSLWLEGSGEGLWGAFEHSVELFDGATVARWAAAYEGLLWSAVEEPELRGSELPLLSAAERQQIVEWSDSGHEYAREATVHELFERQAERTPEAVAVVTADGARLSYGELERRSNRLGRHLRRLGVGAEAAVGLCVERSPEMVIGLLGILKAGGAFVPLDAEHPGERLAAAMADAGARLLVSRRRLAAGEWAAGARLVAIEEEEWAGERCTRPRSGAVAESALYVIYTSGSTGQPKGVVVGHRGMVNRLLWAQREYPLGAGDRVLQVASISFDVAVWECLGPLAAGGVVVLGRAGGQLEVAAQAAQAASEGVTVLHLVPSLLQAWVEDEAAAGVWKGLRYLLTGGETLSPALAGRSLELLGRGAEMHNQYGPTEASLNATVWRCQGGDALRRSVPIGRALSNCRALVLDGLGWPQPIGAAGELVLGGDGLARGYRGRPEWTAARFVPDALSGGRGERVYRTGDRARWLADGTLELLGRLDDQVKVRGVRVEPGEIEAALRAHPLVRDAAVAAHAAAGGEAAGLRLVAYVEPVTPAALAAAGMPAAAGTLAAAPEPLRSWLAGRLPPAMMPAVWVVVERLPRNANGKLDRRALPAPAAAGPCAGGAGAAPRNRRETALAAVWAAVLGLPAVGIHDNFFSLGGDSILSLQVVSRARRAGLRISARQLFEHQTVAALAAAAVEESAEIAAAAGPAGGGPVPLAPAQRAFFARGLAEPHHFNQAVVLALRRPLTAAVLRRALAAVVARHDALRLRFCHAAGEWRQEIAPPSAPPPATCFDLTRLPPARRGAALATVTAEVQASLDLERGPLLRAAWFHLDAEPAAERLLLAVHHLAVDAVSWRVLLEDLDEACSQVERGAAPALAAPATSWRRWAERLHELAASPELAAEAEFWLAIRGERPPARDAGGLPRDLDGGANSVGSTAAITVALAAEPTRRLLQEVPAAYRSRIDDVLLAALTQVLCAWAPGPVLAEVETHGRPDWLGLDLSRTVGWLTASYPLLLTPVPDAPGEALKTVKERLRAVPRQGFGYGLLRYLRQDAALGARLAAAPPAVSFNYLGQLDRALASDGRFAPVAGAAGPLQSPRGERQHQLEIAASVEGGRLVLVWTFSRSLHRRETVTALAAAMLARLELLIEHCAMPDAGGATPSDFPLARLAQAGLDRLLAGRARQVEDVYPLSPMQLGILVQVLGAAGSDPYLSQLTVTLHGELDAAAFREAWRRLVARHSILRTAFAWEALAAPLQIVYRRSEPAWELADLCGLDRDEQQRRIRQQLAIDRARGFDLTRPPLMRMLLVRLGREEHFFVWSHHHLLVDGWSLPLLFDEILGAYDEITGGPPRALRPARQFRDYVAWLAERDSADSRRAHADFWRRRLGDFAAPTPLGLARPAAGATRRQESGGSRALSLTVAATAALAAFARAAQLTLATVVQSAWAVLLSRYSGLDDVLFGAVAAGRPPELEAAESILGLFINTLPVRVEVDPCRPLAGWLRHLQEQHAELRQHDTTPLAEAQRASGVPLGTPLFESLFAFENYPVDESLAGRCARLAISAPRFEEGTQFPLAVTVVPGEALRLEIAFDGRRVDAAAVGRALGHLRTLLLAMPAAGALPPAELPILGPVERHQLLVEWGVAGPEPAFRAVRRSIAAVAAGQPDAPAVIWDGGQLSFAGLERGAGRLAARLRSLGVGPEVPVGICLERSPAVAVAILAVLEAAGAWLPLDPAYPDARLSLLLADAAVGTVIARHALRGRLERLGATVVCLAGAGALCAECAASAAPADAGAGAAAPAVAAGDEVLEPQAAYILHTSGSTGLPKGVLTSQGALSTYAHDMVERFGLTPADRVLQFAPLSFDVIVEELFPAWLAGAAVVFADPDELASCAGLAAAIRRLEVTALELPAPFWHEWVRQTVEAGELPPPSLRLALVGCEQPAAEQVAAWRRFGLPLLNVFGLTEAAVTTTLHRLAGGAGAAADCDLPIGRPVAASRVYLLDAHRRGVPLGVAGELYIGGPGLARGYLGQPGLTAERFVPDPIGAAGGRLYRTGDRARFRADGTLDFLGRLDQQAKVRGFRVEPGEIEAALGRHAGVAACVVTAPELHPGEHALVAYYVPAAAAPSAAALRAFLKARLPEHLLPSHYVQLDALPTNAHGKVDRAALPAPRIAADEQGFVPPRNLAERTLAAIWSEVLGVERVGVDDDFFALGGDSILSLQIVSRAHRAGLRLSPRQVFEHPTVAALAAALDSAAAAATLVVPGGGAAAAGPVPLTPMQRWLLGQEPPEPQRFNLSLLLTVGEPLAGAPLAAAVTALAGHHDALRLRFRRQQDGSWSQRCAAPLASGTVDRTAAPCAQIDLAALPPALRRGALTAAASALQGSLDLERGPLFRAAYLAAGGEGDRLLLIAHHLLVDGVSWRVLTEDLMTAYRQLARREAPRLPPAGSFVRFARRLAVAAAAGIFDDQVPAWLAAAPLAPLPALPVDHTAGANDAGSAGTARLRLDAVATSRLLRDVPRALRTGMQELLLAALAIVLTRWQGAGELWVELEGHGRDLELDGVDLARTVGWLTALYPVCLSVPPGGGPGAALDSVSRRLRSLPAAAGYGVLRHLSPAAGERLAALPRPQVLFNYLGQVQAGADGPGLTLADEPRGAELSPLAPRPYLFEINALVAAGRLEVEWTFCRGRHRQETVEGLLAGCVAALQEIADHCLAAPAVPPVPADFPLAGLDRRQLDALLRGGPPVDDLYPLSPMQQGMLFHTLAQPAAGLYVAQFRCELRGQLDTAAFRGAWERTLARHPVLRSAFLAAAAPDVHRPLQKVLSQVQLPWEEVDWRPLPAAAREVRLASFLDADRRRGFDLASPPLLRLHLIHLAADRRLLICSLHQMVVDGWSLPLLLDEVLATYEDLAGGREPRRPAAMPYRDYIAWLEAQDLAAAERHWRQALAGFDSPTPLPAGAGAAAVAGAGDYGARELRLEPATSEALRSLAQRGGCTLNSVVQGAWGLLLGRWAGSRDVVFGMVTAGRPPELPGVESALGLFINTLPLRLRIDPGAACGAWLRGVQESQTAAQTFQYAPLAQVQAWSEVERGRPLFESILSFQNYPLDRAVAGSRGGLTIAVEEAAEQTNYPLTLVVHPERELLLALAFHRDRFDDDTVLRLLAHLGRLLEEIAVSPHRRLDELSPLAAAERRQLLYEWNRPGAVFAVAAPLHQLFAARAAELADAVAVVAVDGQLSYGELAARAERLARRLDAMGVGAEERVGLFLERSPELVVAILGVLRAGGAYLPLDPRYPGERLAFLLADGGVRTVVTTAALAAALPETAAARVEVLTGLVLPPPSPEPTERLLAAGASAAPAVRCAEAGAENLAYVIYTSGSTGRPKGVAVTHRNVARLFRATAGWFGFGPQEVWTLFHSSSFDFSVWELWGALLHGGRLVVVRHVESRSPEWLYELLAAQRVTVLSQTPPAFRQLLRIEEERGAAGDLALRWVIFGGEALDPGCLRPWYARHPESRPRLVNMYGITETTVHVTFRPLAAADAVSGASGIGAPIPDLQVYVLDPSGQLQPAGAAGELCVGGEGLARGYLGRPDLTASRFVPNPWSGLPGDRLYRSGDLARFRAGGTLDFLGRIDRQVKVRGYRIELGEVEAALLRHPGVREAVVDLELPAGRAGGEPRLVAFVVARGAPGPAADELRAALAGELPQHMVPALFVQLPALPLTAHGKLDRRALPAGGGARPALIQAYEAPRTAAEVSLAAIWSEVLGVDRVGVHDNYFALGGDSIMSLQIVSRARRAGLELSLQQLFSHPTPALLAAALGGGEPACGPLPAPAAFSLLAAADRERLAGEAAGLDDAYPLSQLQAGMLFQSSYAPGATDYHNLWSATIATPFDEAAMRQAVAALLTRHPVLRTSFDLASYGEPLQLVHRAVEAPLVIEDLRRTAGAAALVTSWFEMEKRRPFDWRRPPLVRFHVQRLSDERFQLSLTEHHAILDGWSVAVLLSELFAVYAALRRNEPPPVWPSPPRFAGLIAAERAALAAAAQRRFWQRRLAGSPFTGLPRRPHEAASAAAAAGHVRRLDVPLPPALSDALKQRALAAGVPVKSVLLAAHLRVVGGVCCQPAVVTGLVSHGRPEIAGGERALGLFLNTLPLHLALPGGTWDELIRDCFAAERELLPYRHYPMAELRKQQGGSPLFETAFNFTHFHVLDGLRRSHEIEVSGDRDFTETELTLVADFGLELGSERLTLQLTADLRELPGEQVRSLGQRYAAALESLAAEPRGRYEEASLLSPAERALLLGEWNDTAAAFPGELTLPRLFALHAAARPLAVAVECDGAALTYGDLDRRSNRLARHLGRLGVSPGALVGLFMDRCPEMVVALLAIVKAGAAYVALDTAYPKAHLGFLLADTGVPLVLSLSRLAGALPPHAARTVALDGDAAEIDGCGDLPLDVELTAEHLAYVAYTSGSTGRPKGVEVTHRAVVRLLFGIDHLDLGPGRTLLHLSPLAFDASTLELWGALLHGGRCVLLARRVPSVAELGRVLAASAVDTLALTTSLYNAVIDEVPEVLAGVRQMVVGGEALSVRHVRKGLERLPRVRFVAAYGPTEGTTFSSCHQVPRDLDPAASSVPLGRPIANTRVYLLDPHLQPVPPGTVGELVVAGDGLARGYLRRPDLTAERFIPDPAGGGGRLYRTGDLARHLPDGTLEFQGRTDQQVKVRGFRIEPGEIEAQLRDHPAVAEAVVVAREDVPGSKRLVAYVVAVAGVEIEAGALREHLASRLPEHLVPAAFMRLAALPLAPTGKLDRAALPVPERQHAAGRAAPAPPETVAEQILARLWEQLLGVREVGRQDNFLALGGDSILSIQVVARAQQAGLTLSPRQLFEHPTLAALAAAAAAGGVPAANQGLVSGPLPLTPAAAWFFAQQLAAPQHWNQALLLACAGQLDAAALNRSVEQLSLHHDALRLRLDPAGRAGEAPRPRLAGAAAAVACQRISLAALPPARRTAAIESAAVQVQASLDLEHGPMARFVLLAPAADSGSRLLIVLHHLVVDGLSWRILLEDLERAYGQAAAGQAVHLPAKTASFKEWAESLAAPAPGCGPERELEHWLDAAWREVLPLPVDLPGGDNTEGSTRQVTVALAGEATRALLQEANRPYRTRINDLLLAALARALGAWSGDRGALAIEMEGHGRDQEASGLDLSRTVGWFTALYPVLLPPAAGPGDSVKAVKELLRRIPGGGLGFGQLRYLGAPEIRRRLAELPQPPVLFNYLGQLDQVLTPGSPFTPAAESSGPPRAAGDRRRHLLEINAMVTAGRLTLSLTYSRNLHLAETIERLAAALLAALEEVLEHCLSPAAGGFTPADFPLAALDQPRLDALVGGDRTVEDLYPLAPMQWGMLFHALHSPDSGAYVSQFSCRLRGDLDLEAFSWAMQRLVDRHAVLRTAFVWQGHDEPLQLVRRGVSLPLVHHDLVSLPAELQRERTAAVAAANRAGGFDLARAPLLRLDLLRLGERSHRLVWCFHHLILDGWSVGLLLDELLHLYGARRRGLTVHLSERPPFRGYVAWLRGQDPAPAEAFWRRSLAGLEPPPPLPDRGTVAAARDERRRRLQAAATGELERFARQRQLTLNTLFQGAWGLVLGRLLGSHDVVFGATTSGRPPALAGVESMIGLFINTQPVRVRIEPERDALSWLRQLQSQSVEMRQHESAPLADVARWSGLPSRTALFETLLVFESYPVTPADPAAAIVIDQVSADSPTHYPVVLRITPGRRLLSELLYDTRKLDGAAAEQLLAALGQLLGALLAAPDCRVADLAAAVERAESEAREAARAQLRAAKASRLAQLRGGA